MFQYRDKLMMRKRSAGDIWNGLYDFFLIESKKFEKPERVVLAIENNLIVEGVSKPIKHILTHQTLMTRFVHIKLSSKMQHLFDQNEFAFYSRQEIMDLPKPVLITRYLEETGYLR